MSSPNVINVIDILKEISEYQRNCKSDKNPFPFICVSYAQSLDGYVALASMTSDSSSSNLKLSCDDSFLLTHALRSIHDGIMIGGNTLVTDNPRLNNRLWKNFNGFADPSNEEYHYKQPIPIILDTELKHLSKLIEENTELNVLSSHARIIVCCSKDAKERFQLQVGTFCKNRDVMISLIPCLKSDLTQLLDLKSVLKELKSHCGITSIMVEGGASILSTFLSEDGIKFVNSICVTICPKLIGGMEGLGALAKSSFGFNSGGKEENKKGGMFDLTAHGKCKFYGIGCDSIFLSLISH